MQKEFEDEWRGNQKELTINGKIAEEVCRLSDPIKPVRQHDSQNR